MESTQPSKKVEYPYLPAGRTILYVPSDNIYMLEAKRVARTHSTDRKTSTGAVVVDDKGNDVVSAANQSALKSDFLLKTHPKWCIRRLFGIPSGQKYWMCPGCASARFHAESFAMKKAQQAELDLSGCDLYLWGHWWCCKDCWDAMIKAGIRNVYLMEGAENGFNNSNPVKV